MINRKERLLCAVENGFHSYAEGAAPVLDECRRGCAEDYTIYGSSKIGKNLLKYPYRNTTKTEKGVTYTDNGDGSITVSGTATDYSAFTLADFLEVRPGEKYTLSLNTAETNTNVAFVINEFDADKKYLGKSYTLNPNTASYTFTASADTAYAAVSMKRNNNAECSGTFRPQLELGDTATEYEPYTEKKVGDRTETGYRIPVSVNGQNSANICLAAPIGGGESVSFSDGNLPELPLANGTNTVTVGTEIPPQKISVKYISKVKK